MIRRAWSAHVTEGPAKDRFANSVAARVRNEIEPPFGGSVELVENWLALADAAFAAGETDPDAVDLTPYYEMTNE